MTSRQLAHANALRAAEAWNAANPVGTPIKRVVGPSTFLGLTTSTAFSAIHEGAIKPMVRVEIGPFGGERCFALSDLAVIETDE